MYIYNNIYNIYIYKQINKNLYMYYTYIFQHNSNKLLTTTYSSMQFKPLNSNAIRLTTHTTSELHFLDWYRIIELLESTDTLEWLWCLPQDTAPSACARDCQKPQKEEGRKGLSWVSCMNSHWQMASFPPDYCKSVSCTTPDH